MRRALRPTPSRSRWGRADPYPLEHDGLELNRLVASREALTVWCPGRGGRCTAEPGPKIAKTTPCKVEKAPAQRYTATAASGGTRKSGPSRSHQPNLIPL